MSCHSVDWSRRSVCTILPLLVYQGCHLHPAVLYAGAAGQRYILDRGQNDGLEPRYRTGLADLSKFGAWLSIPATDRVSVHKRRGARASMAILLNPTSQYRIEV